LLSLFAKILYIQLTASGCVLIDLLHVFLEKMLKTKYFETNIFGNT